MKFLFKIFIIWFTSNSISFANEVKIFDFSDTELSKLEVRKVRGAKNKTVYLKIDIEIHHIEWA